LGTVFVVLMLAGAVQLWRGLLDKSRVLLWLLLCAFPFPFIANTAGWTAAELGRQPWLIYGLFRTEQGVSATVNSGSVVFTLIGFVGLYFVVGLLYFSLFSRELKHGPEEVSHD